MRHAGQRLPDGSSDGYGDQSDGLMGSALNSHVNVVNKVQLGWLTGARLQTIDTAGSASYTLAAQSVGADTLQVLEIINNGAHPLSGPVDTFVSFRDTGGFDIQLLDSLPDFNGDAVANSVLVHQWVRSGGSDTLYLRALQEGDSYDEYGVSVSVDQILGDDAMITVARAFYDPPAPTIEISPENFDGDLWVNGWYIVAVTNTNDPLEVGFDSIYDISVSDLGPDWIMDWTSTGEKIVSPGETRNFWFRVLLVSLGAGGRYDFSFVVTDRDGDAAPSSAEAWASYTLLGPDDTTPPSTPTGLTGSVEENSVLLS